MRVASSVLLLFVMAMLAAACGDSSTSDMKQTATSNTGQRPSPMATVLPASPTSTIEPSATTPRPVTTNQSTIPGLPERRQILLLSDLHEWQPYTEFGVLAGPERASYRVRFDEMLPDTDQNAAIFQTQRFSTRYDNVEVSMNMRLHEASSYAESCLTTRADTFESETWSAYFLCISTEGDVWFQFSELLPDGEWRTEQLSDYEPASSIQDLGEWNTLKVVADGKNFWFIVNDVLFGTAVHDGPDHGDVGMYALASGGSADWEYTLLKVYQLETQASAP